MHWDRGCISRQQFVLGECPFRISLDRALLSCSETMEENVFMRIVHAVSALE